MKNRCVNLDWLEVFCIEQRRCDDLYFTEFPEYSVDKRDYGTPMYKEMFTISVNGVPCFEIRRNPYSKKSQGGIFEDGACHIRLTNRFCYSVSPVNLLRDFILRHNYYYVGISRVDICMDFVKFDKNDDPGGFLKAYFQNRYAKINQCNISAHGTDYWNGQYWNSVKWGSPSSMVSTKMYDKTLEMEQTGMKKGYIVDQWRQAQLAEYQIVWQLDKNGNRLYKNVITPWLPHDVLARLGVDRNKAMPKDEVTKATVWRVEFSVKTEGRHWIDLTNGLQYDLNLNTIDTRDKLLFLFHALAAHYFHFKKIVRKSDGSLQRKDRCPDKILFITNAQEQAYKPKALALKPDATRADRIFLHRLWDISQDYEHTTPKERLSAYTLATMMQNNLLSEYARLYAEDIADNINKMEKAGQ